MSVQEVYLPNSGARMWRGSRGLVPYVAMWSSEELLNPQVIETSTGIGYEKETILDRDCDEILWTRAAVRPGVGEPLYSRLHPLRQRRAMRNFSVKSALARRTAMTKALYGSHTTSPTGRAGQKVRNASSLRYAYGAPASQLKLAPG